MLAQYGCTAGGVGWPEVIVLYSHRNRLIGFVKLGNHAHAKHSQVNHWKVHGHTVKVKWVSYEGAGFDIKHRHSTLTFSHGNLHLR